MRPSPEEKLRWLESYQRATKAQISESIKLQLEKAPGGSLSLLDHLQYTPAERSQGSCGNCWVWAGTGVMEIALAEQTGIKDRLSIQYLNSNYMGGSGWNWACCGGWLEYLTYFYAGTDKAIPWSNTNASYADGGRTCFSGSTSMPAGSISTTPSYVINSITTETIPTYGVAQETAIANIKNILNQNRAVWFAFFLADSADWANFRAFWRYDPESSVWNPDFTCGKEYNLATGAGHAVLCVGYNDDNPDNRYWIMVNSWGITSGRPNGIFYLDMDMNYSCEHTGPAGGQAFFWQTLDIAFAPDVPNVLGSYQIRGSIRFYEWAGSRWQLIRYGTLNITAQDKHKVEGYMVIPDGLEWPEVVSIKGYVGPFVRDARERIDNTPRLSLLVEHGEYCQYPADSYATYIINASVKADKKTGAVKSIIKGHILGWGEFDPALDDSSSSRGQFEGRFKATPAP
jgi:hypothetical protein